MPVDAMKTNNSAIKHCSRCDTDKAITEFNNDKYRPDGHSCWCKICVRKNSKTWYMINRDKYLKVKYKYRNAHKKEFNASSRKSYWIKKHRFVVRQVNFGIIPTRMCPKCETEKPLAEFLNRRKSCWCNRCVSVQEWERQRQTKINS